MNAEKRSRLRWVEFAAILVVVVVGAALALPVVRNSINAYRPGTCQDNLRQWGTIFKMYSLENDYRWPIPHGFEIFGSAENAPGCRNVEDGFDFSPDEAVLFPDYMNDSLLYACPDRAGLQPPHQLGPAVLRPWRLDPVEFGILENVRLGSCGYAGFMTNSDANYTYFGWRIDPFDDSHPIVSRPQALMHGLPAEGPAVIVALLAHLQPSGDVTFQDIQARRGAWIQPSTYLDRLETNYARRVGNDGSDIVSVLWHGVDILHLGSDEPPDYPWLAVTPVMWDTIRQDTNGIPTFAHNEPQGINVLYLDGHVEFRPYPGDVFPAIPSFATMRRVP